MLRWFPRLQVATACFSCSPPDLSFLDPYFIFMYMPYRHCQRATTHLQLNILLLLLLLLYLRRWRPGVAQWLRCCATSRTVPGQIPGGVIGFFSDILLPTTPWHWSRLSL